MIYDNSKKTAYLLVLLLGFLIGAFLTFVYTENLEFTVREYGKLISYGFAFVLLINIFLFSALVGLVFQPVTSVFIGGFAAIWAYNIKLVYLSGEDITVLMFLPLVTIPLHFVICSFGMRLSSKIRSLACIEKDFYDGSLCSAYALMIFAITIMFVYVSIIMN